MNKILLFILGTAMLLLFAGCPYGYKYNDGHFPAEPVNASFLNSIYDDYNMAAPIIEGDRYLYFSSNRNSFGEEFDLVGNNFHVDWDKDEGVLRVDGRQHAWKDTRYTDTLFSMINDGHNQFGPYSLPFYEYVSLQSNYTDVLIYAGDEKSHLDLKYVCFHGEGQDPSPWEGEFIGPMDIDFLNSSSDDAYLAFWGRNYVFWDYGVDPNMIEEVYFCSNRGGQFDIFSLDYPDSMGLVDFLGSDSVFDITSVEILNSGSDDKCPYIDGSLLVFASDRPGGFGGFDLYYSTRQGNKWSEPKNFGDKINSEHNEYRPIVMLFSEFDEDLLLFSSDRPGGKGGYDLYYAGIPSMID